MLVRHVPDAYEKLRILGGMAGDDILSPSGAGHGTNTSRMPYRSPSKNPAPRRLQGLDAQREAHQPDEGDVHRLLHDGLRLLP